MKLRQYRILAFFAFFVVITLAFLPKPVMAQSITTVTSATRGIGEIVLVILAALGIGVGVKVLADAKGSPQGEKQDLSSQTPKIKSLNDIYFSAFYPLAGTPGTRYKLIVYAHTQEVLPAVFTHVHNFTSGLGGEVNVPKRAAESATLEVGTLITVIPEAKGFRIVPVNAKSMWNGSWICFPFDFDLPQEAVGQTLEVFISIKAFGIQIDITLG
ncbi:MAG: hypothetical protein ACYDBJ_09600 [Aggregatilineales bacterium]